MENKIYFISLLVLALCTLFVADAAQLAGSWPPAAKSPPFQAKWAPLLNAKSLPKIPVVQKYGNCTGIPISSCNFSCSLCVRPASDVFLCPKQKDWGLSFDDGPGPSTDKLLDYFNKRNVKVTFFVIGSNVVLFPEILKKAVDQGHEIGIHTWSHSALTTLSNEQVVAELKWTEEAIRAATGFEPKLMRPPFGDYDDRIREIVRQLGYRPAIWDRDSKDYVSVSDPTFDLNWVTGNFSIWAASNDPTGHISLQHDLYEKTLINVPQVVEILQNSNFNIAPISVCANIPPWNQLKASGPPHLVEC